MKTSSGPASLSKGAGSKTLKIYGLISKSALYLLAFLLPIFFLPWTANVLDS